MAVRIRVAQRDDLPAVGALLKSFDLTAAGVEEHVHEFLVAEDTGEIVASSGLEVYGSGALLRSVAVHPDYRNRGLAKGLVTQLLDRARRAGVRDVYLLTTTAEAYFRRMGFATVARTDVDDAVRQSAEFGDSLCAGAVAMRLRLPGTSGTVERG